ncbi:3-hydroxyacyl-CoA dehydrogenase NAD-binding domain-containing protein [Thalassobaculum litoreum]|uniref:Short chain enoyl-CoA hydratase n=1 Tax=Thalassobaculum litoreum DSM 18839 TaxID=1123362 RepID=A0A8G2EX33_9PROT|nr:3-hydroxyacyl-CoA dehydrogenase NAD-binding domain-containing protein [Thalassobaculum litoreum]SDF06613.1 short chain enoyl-CoA hydratase [Thalassobaculum litoreum DSM 18839]
MSAVIEERRGRVALLRLNNPPVNGLGWPVREGLDAAVGRLSDDPDVDAIVLTGNGRMFCAGADIREFGTATPEHVRRLTPILDDLEGLDKPVVAAIHGVAAGGGMELALGCHYRVCGPKTKLGLPEVTLGILPGAGGTQRMPRVAGVSKALELIVSGRLISEKEAFEAGIVDELVEGDVEAVIDAAVAAAERLAAAGEPPRRSGQRTDRLHEAKDNPGLFDAFRESMAKRARGMNAPYACVRCVEAATRLDLAEGLAFERQEFEQLVNAVEAQSMRHAFFAEREVAKIPDVPKDTATRPIQTAGIVGCGTMGGGIAMVFANAGIPVMVVENDQAALDAGIAKIAKNYAATVSKGRLTQAAMDQRMGLITGTTDFLSLAATDMVVEAVFEDMAVKKELFAKLDGICKPGAILATNTSTLDVDEIATATKRPQDVIGTHFFSPANVMRLMENVRGAKTADDVIATVMGLSKTLGKVGVLVGVCHGFVGNRMLHQYLREAMFLVEEGALPQDIDRVMYDFGMPMGPFAMCDLAGNDVGWRVRQEQIRAQGGKPSNTRYSGTVADKICDLGRFGQKTGKGWFAYADGRTPQPDPEVEAIIVQTSKELGIARRAVSDDEILERCLYPLVNEGAKILDEGIALRASDIDVVWMHGYGFPRFRGGPMFWADTVGLKTIAATLQRFEKDQGPWMAPSPLLLKLAEEGKGFGDA